MSNELSWSASSFHLKNQCSHVHLCVYSLAEIGQFQKIVGGLMELMDELAKEVETEKMKVSSEAAFILLLYEMVLSSCV